MSEAAVVEAFGLLQKHAKRLHRGRADTWGGAVDRVAGEAGIPPTYAARLWHRWRTMTDVSGGVLLALQAYDRFCEATDAFCEANENAAARMRAEREEIENGASLPGSQNHRVADPGVVASPSRAAPPAVRRAGRV